ncbi:MAG: aspartate carbamoyltransferase [Patescibacteria group bacterium]|jgi:aspartate carbamoyltransferase catalytic subunit
MFNVLTGQQFADKKTLKEIFNKAAKLQKQDEQGNIKKDCAGKIVATLFYESSTRTRLSFESAAYKLGANVLSVANAAASSASKGESLTDTIKVVSGFSDAIVLRHPENGAAETAAKVSSVPIINGGDGFNEHPTQALYDLYTIEKELGKIDGLKIAFLADFRYQRNIHSLIPLFPLFKKVELFFISPPELRLPNEYKDILSREGIKYEELENLDKVIEKLDVLYVTRVFKERFSDPAEYERLKQTLHIGMEQVNRMKVKSIILHVMPRIYEIDPAVDADSRAAYFRQAHNGLYVRMALLHKALTGK